MTAKSKQSAESWTMPETRTVLTEADIEASEICDATPSNHLESWIWMSPKSELQGRISAASPLIRTSQIVDIWKTPEGRRYVRTRGGSVYRLGRPLIPGRVDPGMPEDGEDEESCLQPIERPTKGGPLNLIDVLLEEHGWLEHHEPEAWPDTRQARRGGLIVSFAEKKLDGRWALLVRMPDGSAARPICHADTYFEFLAKKIGEFVTVAQVIGIDTVAPTFAAWFDGEGTGRSTEFYMNAQEVSDCELKADFPSARGPYTAKWRWGVDRYELRPDTTTGKWACQLVATGTGDSPLKSILDARRSACAVGFELDLFEPKDNDETDKQGSNNGDET